MRAKTIGQLKEILDKIPSDLSIRIYEGGVEGIVIEDNEERQVYFIDTSDCEMVCVKCKEKHTHIK